MKPITTAVLCIGLAALTACRDRAAADAGAPQAGAAAPAPTNRVDIPAPVRQNLGITFARVERRAVARTMRVPGRFELIPEARRDYHAPLGGRVELMVSQYQLVEAGTPLYRLDSPGWRALQREIAEAEGSLRRARAEDHSAGPLLEAHGRHRESLEATVRLWTRRVEQLEEIRAAGGGRADDWTQAQASLSEARAQLADVMERTAELEARRTQVRAELEASQARFELLLASAATVLGVSVDRLMASDGGQPPMWRQLATVEVPAVVAGTVESLSATSGSWVEEKAAVLSTIQPGRVRFRARGLQSDLGRLRDGLPARVVPPSGGTLARGGPDAIEGTLALGLVADPDQRTLDLLLTPPAGPSAAPPTWARAGVSGFLEIVTEGEGSADRADLAIPLAAVVRDGLTPVIFRRDPGDPDKAIRLEADLGLDDGRWVIVRSGLREGDEVVVDGVSQLMLATSGSAAKGGHFHSDGTFHEGGDH